MIKILPNNYQNLTKKWAKNDQKTTKIWEKNDEKFNQKIS